jgi:hypothetical protein
MKLNPSIFCLLVTMLAVLGGCSSERTAKESKGPGLDRIQGKAQVSVESTGATDAAMNAGGPSIYLLEGTRRYRLYVTTPVEVADGKEYVAEGIYAQKAIDEIGDPDQGKNGYPLESSCEHIVRKAWANISFDAVEPTASVVRARVKRYPARPLFLVTRIRPVTSTDTASADSNKGAAVEEDNSPEVSVAADKQRASLIEGPTTQKAPLWEPTGGTASCKVLINSKGKIAHLETGAQLCEAVDWSQFRFQPTVQGGHPVQVRTEVEVRFEPQK